MPDTPPPVDLELAWAGGRRFTGHLGPVEVTLDAEGRRAPTPVQALALALGGCMAMDVVEILTKARVPLEGLRVRVTGERAAEPPRRFVGFTLRFRAAGAVPPDRLAQALELSRERYCSVWHSLRPDIVLRLSAEVPGTGGDSGAGPVAK